jgi:hypothetical protein
VVVGSGAGLAGGVNCGTEVVDDEEQEEEGNTAGRIVSGSML